MGVELISARSFGDLAEQARRKCRSSAVMNLALSIECRFPFLEDPFLDNYVPKARQWQLPYRPDRLHLNHGEYMHRDGDAIAYLTNQLKLRPTGNRACVSLLSMSDLINSGDDPRPSFMVVQAGFAAGTTETLHLTAYYRALEVSGFLPVNLAEMALIATSLQQNIITIEQLQLTIFAFRAYSAPGFTRLERAEIDTLATDDIDALVEQRNVSRLSELITEKMRTDSVVEFSGLAALQTSLLRSSWNPEAAITALDMAISTLAQLKEARKSGSHAQAIPHLHDRAVDYLRRVLEQLEDSDRGTQ
ncbi:thymidylate synthase family protein [Saccharothrix variisporea]|uniref:Uncharacterized protein n=1 Tax=Saccharothrix variisporea TaxID=543527 RepID=A0A495XD71_9PSEU|nr:hypothetical protein [Saccharothrix variisporea]RKT72431.1 hypothetical protein DFJ66_5742 [Saccharothrix variisporea]